MFSICYEKETLPWQHIFVALSYNYWPCRSLRCGGSAVDDSSSFGSIPCNRRINSRLVKDTARHWCSGFSFVVQCIPCVPSRTPVQVPSQLRKLRKYSCRVQSHRGSEDKCCAFVKETLQTSLSGCICCVICALCVPPCCVMPACLSIQSTSTHVVVWSGLWSGLHGHILPSQRDAPPHSRVGLLLPPRAVSETQISLGAALKRALSPLIAFGVKADEIMRAARPRVIAVPPEQTVPKPVRPVHAESLASTARALHMWAHTCRCSCFSANVTTWKMITLWRLWTGTSRAPLPCCTRSCKTTQNRDFLDALINFGFLVLTRNLFSARVSIICTFILSKSRKPSHIDF